MPDIITIGTPDGGESYPVTKEKAVYDDNGVRLDNKLTAINNNLVQKGTYSTEEILVGKWNSYNLYRKCFTYTTSSTNDFIPNSVVNGTVVDIRGSILRGSFVACLQYYVSASDNFRTFYDGQGVQVRKSSDEQYTWRVIVEYYR